LSRTIKSLAAALLIALAPLPALADRGSALQIVGLVVMVVGAEYPGAVEFGRALFVAGSLTLPSPAACRARRRRWEQVKPHTAPTSTTGKAPT